MTENTTDIQPTELFKNWVETDLKHRYKDVEFKNNRVHITFNNRDYFLEIIVYRTWYYKKTDFHRQNKIWAVRLKINTNFKYYVEDSFKNKFYGNRTSLDINDKKFKKQKIYDLIEKTHTWFENTCTQQRLSKLHELETINVLTLKMKKTQNIIGQTGVGSTINSRVFNINSTTLSYINTKDEKFCFQLKLDESQLLKLIKLLKE